MSDQKVHETMTAEGVCPRCDGATDRDVADVGVGVLYGPWGCTEGCGWSEWEEYDSLFGGGLQPDGGYRDPQGGYWPKGNPVVKMMKGGSDV